MFVDEAIITVRAGNGGDGVVSFHREKYISKGGPDGGDGGPGGDVILVADPHMASLIDFEHETSFAAEHGRPGEGNLRTGRSGKSRSVRVPLGSVVSNAETGEVYGDLSIPGQELVVALGGSPGRGNAAFTTSTRQAPQFCERGLAGEKVTLKLELKLLADIGLVGLPNAGKSSLLRVISAAKPKVASYPFTTLQPELGVYRMEVGESYVVADVPGLIEGAHQGVGLGDAFLRHLERTRVLIHLVDVSLFDHMDPIGDYKTIRAEIEAFGRGIADLPVIVGLSKMDLAEPELVDEIEAELAEIAPYERHRFSSATGQGVTDLMAAAVKRVRAAMRDAAPPLDAPKRLVRPGPAPRSLRVEGPIVLEEAQDGEAAARLFEVTGDEVELLVARSHLNNNEAVLYLHSELVRMGVLDRLERRGAREGDTVRIGAAELEYVDSAGVRDY